VARGPKQTAFEALRAEFETIRKVVGDDTYLSFGGDAPDRAVVGLVDASRIARPALRSDLRGVMDEAILSLPLCGRWFAADFDDVYLGTRTQFGAPPKNESRVEGGWQMVRAWLSLAGLAGGAVLTSDPVYAPDFRDQWTNLDAITPPLNRPMVVPGLFTHAARSALVTHVERPWGRWTLALLRNVGKGPEVVRLDFAGLGLDPKASYAVWGYWDNRLLGVFQGSWQSHYLQHPDFQFVRLTELVPRSNFPTLVGSHLHISCGAEEIASIDATRAGMTIRLTEVGAAGGDLFIHSRFPPVVKEARGCTVEAIALVAENIWRVRIAGRDLRSPQAITLAFLLPLTAQPWFWISIIAVAASLIFALWRYIVSLHARRDQGLAEERARIAQDLHDDLGASLARLAYHGDALLDAHGLDPAGAGHAEKMREIARGTSRALDEIVWAVDPKQDTLESFAGYLSSLAQELLSDANVRCRFDFPDDLHDRPLSSRHRHHIFLATKEALLNIIRHARATEARIRLVLGDKECHLEIEDDGCGFDPSAAPGRPGGGHGLASLRKRMEIVGGRCEMESRSGAGTSIRFIWKTES
jgi:signal transduction histidine kinase